MEDNKYNPGANLAETIQQHAADQPDKLACQFLENGSKAGASLSYRQLDQRASTLAQQLEQQLNHADRVILLYPAGLDFIEGFMACLYAGVVAIPAPTPDAVQFKRAWPRLQAIIDDAEVSLILTNSGFQAKLIEHLEQTALANTRILVSDELDTTADQPYKVNASAADELAYLQYTSGSIAAPKGVMISHSNLLAQLQDLQSALNYSAANRSLNWMPHHHDYGLVQGLLLPLYSGASVYLMSPASFIRKPERWLQAISQFQISHSQGSNFAYAYCLRRFDPDKQQDLDLSCWQAASIGAEPINPEAMQQFERTLLPFGFKPGALVPAFGLAEATLVVSTRRPGEGVCYGEFETKALLRQRAVETENQARRTLIGCGQSLANNTRIRIVDPETHHACQANEIGEIWVSGPSVAQGYLNRPQETAETFQAYLADSEEGPFLRTGDLGFLKDGELFIAGRHKDLIIIRGQNHYPKDIEFAAEASHPKLRAGRCAAFSVEAAVSEQLIVVAEFMGSGDEALYTSVAAAINEAVALAAELTPHAIVLIRSGSLPVTSSGKIQRQACRKLYSEQGLDSLYLQVHDTADESLQQQAPAHDLGKRQVLSQCLLAAPDQIDEATLRAYLLSVLAEVLRTSGLERLKDDQDLLELGIDSLASVEIRGYLEDELKLSLPINLLFQYPKLAQLSAFLKQRLGQTHAQPATPTGAPNDAAKRPQRHYNAADKQRLLDWQVQQQDAAYDLTHDEIQQWDRLSLPPDKVQMRRRGTRVITDDWKPEQPIIGPDTKVLGMGSCFTRDIVLWLAECGFNQDFPGSPYNALLRYPASGNNAYLAEQFSILDKLDPDQLATTAEIDEQCRFLDAESDAGQQLYNLLKGMDVLFLTLGGVENWRDAQTGKVLQVPLVLAEYSPQRHQLGVDSYADTLMHLELIDQVTQKHFPQLKIIFTLPLGRMTTYRPLSALNAASAMEATLRAAMGEFLDSRLPDAKGRIHYFPAFEMATQFFADPYQTDNIHATPYVTGRLCAAFAEMFCQTPPQTPANDALAEYDPFHSQAMAISLDEHKPDADEQEMHAKVATLEASNASLQQVCDERLALIETLDRTLREHAETSSKRGWMQRLRSWLMGK